MPNPDAYLERAEAAEAQAGAAQHPRDREQLLEIAAEWRLLAAEASAAPPKDGPERS